MPQAANLSSEALSLLDQIRDLAREPGGLGTETGRSLLRRANQDPPLRDEVQALLAQIAALGGMTRPAPGRPGGAWPFWLPWVTLAALAGTLGLCVYLAFFKPTIEEQLVRDVRNEIRLIVAD